MAKNMARPAPTLPPNIRTKTPLRKQNPPFFRGDAGNQGIVKDISCRESNRCVSGSERQRTQGSSGGGFSPGESVSGPNGGGQK